MNWAFWRSRSSRVEQRGSIESPAVPLSNIDAWRSLIHAWKTVSGQEVNESTVYRVAAFTCGVRFLGMTMGALPLHLYSRKGDVTSKMGEDPLDLLLHDIVNDDLFTSFKWRWWMMSSIFATGRAFTFIERNRKGDVMNFWPLLSSCTTVVRKGGRTYYEYREGVAPPKVYEASEVIDVPYQLLSDGITHVNPLHQLADTLGLSMAMTEYAAHFFQNGGVPPLAMVGPPASPGAMDRAKADVMDNLRRNNSKNANVLYLPTGHDLKPVGFNPGQGQMTEARIFQLQEVSRILNLPPVFLHDLSHGTYTNTEQQDLNLAKHTVSQWSELIEQELNAKLFGRVTRTRFAEFNLDGLLRGDFKTRMEGLARGVNSAIYTPDEARGFLNLPAKKGPASKLHIQGATVPLGSQALKPVEPPKDPADNPDEADPKDTQA